MTDTRTIVVSVIGTGIAVVTVVVGFMAIIAGGINSRFDDVSDRITRVDARIDELSRNVNARIDELSRNVNSRIDDVNARIDDTNARIDDLQSDVRELRALVIDAIKNDEPAID